MRFRWMVSSLALFILFSLAARFGEATSRELAHEATGNSVQIASSVLVLDKGEQTAHVYLGETLVMRLFADATSGLPLSDRANWIVSHLNQLANDGKELGDVSPGVVHKNMVGQLGEEILFTVEPQDAKKNRLSPPQLAFLWCNEIKEALGKPLLLEPVLKETIREYRVQTTDIQVTTRTDGGASLLINGNPLLTLYAPHRGHSAKDRVSQIASRIASLIESGGTGKMIMPGVKKGDLFVIRVGKEQLLQVDKREAKLRHVSPWNLTLRWVNQLREALWAEPFSRRDVKIAYSQMGGASWYAGRFEGRPTSSGAIYSNALLTAAHRTLPFGTHVLVTCFDTGRSVVVRINDRGPYVRGRIIDLSYRAAKALDLIRRGVGRVRVDVIGEHAPEARELTLEQRG